MSTRGFRRRLGLAVATAVIGTVVGPVAAHAAGARTVGVRADFNGDGYAGLAVAAPWGRIDGHARAGYVGIAYGSAKGLNTAHRQVISRDTAGIPGVAEADDHFGSGLALGDLDGDGYADLVVGAGGEDVGSVRGAGTLTVVWGGPKGLSGGSTVATGEEGDRVNAQQPAVGDFNGDGHLDLATANRLLYGLFGRTTGAAHSGDLSLDSDYATDDVAAGDIDHDGITDLVGLIHDYGDEDSTDSEAIARRAVYLHGTRQGPSRERHLVPLRPQAQEQRRQGRGEPRVVGRSGGGYGRGRHASGAVQLGHPPPSGVVDQVFQALAVGGRLPTHGGSRALTAQWNH
ncbi:VCBS repeat-containing protein [Streptomyces sp. NPDC005202]|uniref:VCBS repeat-containing protein n=1 Tax=Streptomyces sp. NPDC005202 TaxID=3157021 RepID=UPI0033A15472